MDISEEIHEIKNSLMVALYGLEPEADEECRRMGRKGIADATEKLDEINKKVREGEA